MNDQSWPTFPSDQDATPIDRDNWFRYSTWTAGASHAVTRTVAPEWCVCATGAPRLEGKCVVTVTFTK